MAAAAFASQATSSVGNSLVSASALRSQGEYQKRVAGLNAKTMEEAARRTEAQADDAVSRGETAANQRGQDIRKKVGSQRAAAAAAGLDPNFGSAADVMADTESVGAADQAAIKTNAWREAFGYKSQSLNLQSEAVNSTLRGETANLAAMNTARNTMITGGLEGAQYGLMAGGEVRKRNPTPEELPKDKTTKSTKRKPNQAFGDYYGGDSGSKYGVYS